MSTEERINAAATLLQKAAGTLEEIAEDEVESYKKESAEKYGILWEIDKLNFIADIRRYEKRIESLSETLAAVKAPTP